MDPGTAIVVAACITVVGAVFGAVAGGFVGGWLALRASRGQIEAADRARREQWAREDAARFQEARREAFGRLYATAVEADFSVYGERPADQGAARYQALLEASGAVELLAHSQEARERATDLLHISVAFLGRLEQGGGNVPDATPQPDISAAAVAFLEAARAELGE